MKRGIDFGLEWEAAERAVHLLVKVLVINTASRVKNWSSTCSVEADMFSKEAVGNFEWIAFGKFIQDEALVDGLCGDRVGPKECTVMANYSLRNEGKHGKHTHFLKVADVLTHTHAFLFILS